MAAVETGRVLILGAGGPVGAAAIAALKDHYALRITDARPLAEAAKGPRQSPRAPLPELPGPPHEDRVVDVTDYDQVRAAVEGMDAVINLTVVRPHPVLAFRVNMVGAYHVARACAECQVERLIHTGPFHSSLGYDCDWHHDFGVGADVPLHPVDDLYALSKYLGNDITRIFAEERGLEVLTFLYCHFRPREVLPEERGRGISSYAVSWEDTGTAFLHGLRAGPMPSPYEVFFICARLPHDQYRPDKARRLLGWEAKDTFEELYRRPEGGAQ